LRWTRQVPPAARSLEHSASATSRVSAAFAAKADVDPDLDAEGARRALWPTPNSMREVEPGAPFVLRHVLKTEGN
jgi:hypothetical protein